MTTKAEEVRTQDRVEQFLLKLADPKKSERIPSYVRDEARMLLRHLASPRTVERGSIQ